MAVKLKTPPGRALARNTQSWSANILPYSQSKVTVVDTFAAPFCLPGYPALRQSSPLYPAARQSSPSFPGPVALDMAVKLKTPPGRELDGSIFPARWRTTCP